MGVLLTIQSCNKWEEPEFEAPKYTGAAANHTIRDIINVYSAAGKMDSICHGSESFIVKATVVSSDEGGNFYKNMIVQDETGAIQIQINKSGLCHTYPVGQTVYINCKGLVVGNYHGMYQIGWIYNGDVGRIDGHFLDQYLTKDGLPQEVTPLDITSPSDLSAENAGRLVRIRNCTFKQSDIGEPWSTEISTTSRYIATINGNSVSDLVVRTSNYAKFRKALVPDGTGDIVGILSVYNTTYQLMLRTKDDVESFGHIQDVYPVSMNETSCDFNGGWMGYQGYMAHPNATATCDDWLVSPAIAANSINGSTLYVEQNLIGTDANVNNTFTIWYTTNYTGDAATTEWIQLPYTDVQTSGFYSAQIAKIDNLSGNVRFGFRYKATASYGGNWAVKALHFNKLVSNE